MLTKRIIACLDVHDGRVVKGIQFVDLVDAGDPAALATCHAREGADVAINYLPAEEPDAREVVSLIKKEGRICIPIPGDLREEAFC